MSHSPSAGGVGNGWRRKVVDAWAQKVKGTGGRRRKNTSGLILFFVDGENQCGVVVLFIVMMISSYRTTTISLCPK